MRITIENNGGDDDRIFTSIGDPGGNSGTNSIGPGESVVLDLESGMTYTFVPWKATT